MYISKSINFTNVYWHYILNNMGFQVLNKIV